MTAFFRKKYFIGIVIIVAALIIAAALVFFALKDRPNDAVLALPDIAAPNGWYAHRINDIGPQFILYTRSSTLPNIGATEGAAWGEQIDVDVATTTLSPEDYIAHEGFDGPAGQIFESGWAMLNNYRLFTIRGQGAEGELFKSEFLFASGTVYNFNLYPDDAKDYADLDRIVGEISVGLR